MTTVTRELTNIGGANVTIPTQNGYTATGLEPYANDAAFEAVHGAGSVGDIYFNTTEQQIRVYKNGAWEYHYAAESVYDNATSGLAATDVQAAIDEVEGRVDTAETNISTNSSDIAANTSDIADIRTTQGTSDGDTNLGTFTGSTISDNGSVKAGMQDLETAVEGKQADVITTRGDTIIGNASNEASRLAIGSSGFVLTSDGTDVAWAPSAGGSGGATGKNYILNPDAAVNATSDVSNTATTGSWTIARTTTAAELPEETKGTAFKISGSTLTVGDYVEWDIESTGIDDADGGIFGTAKVSVLDISGSINGEYKIQVYNSTDSVYVGDEDTITGTGTYYLDVPLIGTNSYKFRLKAATASPTNIGLSGVTIEPVSQTVAGVTSKWETYTPTFTNMGSPTHEIYWRINGQNIEIRGEFSGAAGSGTVPNISLPNDYTMSLQGSTTQVIGWCGLDQSNVILINVLGTDGDTVFHFGRILTNSTSVNHMTEATQSSTFGSARVSFYLSVPVAELANAHTPTISDVQYENARLQATMSALQTISTASTTHTIDFDTVSKISGFIDNGDGTFDCLASGEYRYSASLEYADSYSGTDNYWGLYNETDALFVGKRHRVQISIANISPSHTNEVTLEAGKTYSLAFARGATSGTRRIASNESTFSIERISDYSARRAGLPFNRWQIKELTADVSSDGNLLTFNNLTIGNKYEVFVQAQVNISSGTAQVEINHDSVREARAIASTSLTVSTKAIFKATATTVTIDGTGLSGTCIVQGTGTTSRNETFSIIRELNMDADETTAFT